MASKKAVAPKKDKSAAKAAKPVSNATGIVLEGGIDIPARTRSAGASPYPFASMAVAPAENSTFLIKAEVEPALYTNEKEAEDARLEEARKIANRLSGATRRFTKSNPGFKFAVRTVPEGVRVWRTE